MSSAYRPGRTRRSLASRIIPKQRIAWVRTFITSLAIMRYTPEDMALVENNMFGDDIGEPNDTIRLMISTTSGRPYTLNITAMTADEAQAFFDCIELCKRLSLPIILARDEEAKRRYANGDDSFSRSYRQVPQFIVRKRAFGPDDQGVLFGLTHTLEGPELPNASDEEFRAKRAAVAQSVPADSGPQDDRQALDEPSYVGEVGGLDADAQRLHSADASSGDAAPAE